MFCAAGFYSSDNKSCLACDVGTYKSTLGNDACTPCPANWTTHDIASTSISQCSLGKLKGNNCVREEIILWIVFIAQIKLIILSLSDY